MLAFSPELVLSVLALACSIVAVLLARTRSDSATAKQALKQAAEMTAAWGNECALFSATRERWQQEFAGIAERCDETLDRAESKRRRIAASDSRQPPPPATQTRAEVIEAARQRAFGRTG
jgi:hypothetical protein